MSVDLHMGAFSRNGGVLHQQGWSRAIHRPMVAMTMALAVHLAGCASTDVEPNRIATSSISMPEHAEAVSMACRQEEANSSVTVHDVLQQARSAGERGAMAGVGKQDSASGRGASQICPGHPATSASAEVRRSGAAEDKGAARWRAGLIPELTIDFGVAAQGLGHKERSAITSAGRAHKEAGGVEIRVYAGPAGTGNPFEQIVVAQRRARLVGGLLPAGITVVAEFDPSQDEDTVRIEFVSR